MARTDTRKKRKRTLEFEEIIRLYQEGKETSEIAELANVSARYIRRVLNNNNIEMRPFGSWKRQYSLNEDFFKNWSNNMAYILGFIVADGCISGNTQVVIISQKEPGILEEIKSELGSNQPLQKNEITGVYLLNLNSKVLKDDLINIHGITPNKSSTVLFPYVPDEYLSHFVRGYFDGDGNINYQKYVVSFVGGSFEFMNALYELLTNKGFNPQIIKRQNYYRVIISGRLTIQLFAQWIYTNGNLYLKRKLSNFQQEQHPITELLDRKQKRTKNAVSLRKKNFLEEYQHSSCIKTSCAAIGIKQSTFHKWCKTDKNFHHTFNDLTN